jgi:hypothetical protein
MAVYRDGKVEKERGAVIVQQDFVLRFKQLSAALRQVRFEGLLVHKQMIQRAIEAILVDLLIPDLKQIATKRGSRR